MHTVGMSLATYKRGNEIRQKRPNEGRILTKVINILTIISSRSATKSQKNDSKLIGSRFKGYVILTLLMFVGVHGSGLTSEPLNH